MTYFNLAFYAYFYGSNNNTAFKIPCIPSLKYKCYYYTNNENLFEQLKSTQWIGIYDDKPTNDDLIESCMIGKHIKTMPQEYFELKDYDYLCYLDSKLEKVNETFVENFISKYFIEQNYALLLREHWFVHNNIWNEYTESMHQHRYRLESDKYKIYIANQVKNGLSEITEKHCACGFLIRNMKHKNIIEINKTWYQHIQECGIQDQISFFFVKQLFNDFIYPFTEIPFISYIESVKTNYNLYKEISYIKYNMESVENKYTFLSNTTSDINEHLPTLYKYATECESIIELGVRGCVSSWAFTWGLLNNNKADKKLILNDITACDISELLSTTQNLNINISYKWINDLDIVMYNNVDLTFIDTWHIYGQLKRELDKFSKVTHKYIIMHDTTVDEFDGETIRSGWNAEVQSQQSGFPVEEINCGLWKAIEEFLSNNTNWILRERFVNNNGLTVLERIH